MCNDDCVIGRQYLIRVYNHIPALKEYHLVKMHSKTWHVGHERLLKLDGDGVIMAIVNATPDSFSDGGQHNSCEAAVAHALRCVEEGAQILDIGGESTRPGAAAVSAQQEQDRVLPVIERLSKETDALISIDTYRAQTARLALEAGAHIVNDVHGLQREPEIAGVVKSLNAGVCIMHTSRDRSVLPDPVADQHLFFQSSMEIAKARGIADEAIMLDPGFGFGKSKDDDLQLMARFSELLTLGYPLLVGTSRKRTLGALTGHQLGADRDIATAATSAVLRLAGAVVFRVHNVAATRDALKVSDAILATKRDHLAGEMR